jgi:hypothetical protein
VDEEYSSKMRLEIEGLGIIMYSPFAVVDILEQESYFSQHYATPEQVQQHIQAGTIVSFGTSSSGTYLLDFVSGYPDEDTLRDNEFKLRLGVEVRDGLLCVGDVFDLMDWTKEIPPERIVEIEDGFYHISLCSNTPASGIIGDSQEILVYMNKLESMPKLANLGVPTLC